MSFRYLKSTIIWFFLILSLADLRAQTNAIATQEATIGLEIDGLVLNETRTRIGGEFYELFFKQWVAPREASNFTIILREKPGRGRGSQIIILINEQLVFVRQLPPQVQMIQPLVKESFRVLHYQLIEAAQVRNQLGDGDQFGNGIF